MLVKTSNINDVRVISSPRQHITDNAKSTFTVKIELNV